MRATEESLIEAGADIPTDTGDGIVAGIGESTDTGDEIKATERDKGATDAEVSNPTDGSAPAITISAKS